MKRTRRPKDEILAEAHARQIRAFELRQSGKLLKQIGAILGDVCPSRAAQLVEAGRKLVQKVKSGS